MTNQTLSATPARLSFNPADTPRRSTAVAILLGLWLVIFFASLFAPPLLDDADATHANAARHIALTGDFVTLHVNGIRYLEKAPLPYWLDALSFRIFGFNTFAAHFPQAIAVLLLALIGFHWASRAFGNRTAFYTGLGILTSIGVFLFTRIYIPEVLLTLFLCTSLYCLLRCLQSSEPNIVSSTEAPKKHVISTEAKRSGETPVFSFPSATYAYLMWASLALAVLSKGLVAIVFLLGTAIVYLALTGDYKNWRALKPFTGTLLFLAIAAPWHILAGLRNTNGMNGHGFFWFYFVNEHFLRFLGKRFPKDYNKLPGYLFWSLHIVWLFPWSLFGGALIVQAYRAFKRYAGANPFFQTQNFFWQPFAVAIAGIFLRDAEHIPYLFTVFVALALFLIQALYHRQKVSPVPTPLLGVTTFQQSTTLILTLYSVLVLVFFSISTNQEYYTFPVYLAILLLVAVALTHAEDTFATDKSSRRWIIFAHVAFMLIGFAVAIALVSGLWSSRHLPFVPDIGDLLAHRDVGNYTLSMSHFFDLTDASFAALRLPAALAAITFCLGPAIAWMLRAKKRHLAATTTIALTSTVFLIAAHIAFVRFAPMLSSKKVADKIQTLEATGAISRDNTVLLYGDQAYGSSIPFYLGRQVDLVEGRSTSMLFGSYFPDAPHIFLSNADLLKIWGTGDRKLLFVPLEKRDNVDQLLGTNKILLQETSGKALYTDRPLNQPSLQTHP
ncbi:MULTISPECIES: glycosyltransferase family 39 protein [Acidobacteriaceae]|uniref:ArnT family glycosyltransferase n=1 Tax=Acidobacteriaceae TaxID=204434 RepID=UPI00131BE33E|nr:MULTISPECIES: glycosyltransferase family 39 protein [Acidobacteriaceae]MDW5264958.1 glycosyltransferase family 39 protein [Edaphobacter sp.]